jgi:hypothetical protein
MLRLLIKDITVEKRSDQKKLSVHIRWQGGACSDLFVQLPPNFADQVRYPAALVDRVRDLARTLLDSQIADQFNRDGLASATGKPYTVKMIQWIRRCHGIPPATLQKPEELTVQQVAKHFAVSDHVVYYWIAHGLIQARRLNYGKPYWITLNPADEQNLRNRVRNSSRIQDGSASLNAPRGGAL